MTGSTVEQAVRQRGLDIAYRIRAELVCCDLYGRVQRGELTFEQAGVEDGYHAICYWGEASARIAGGECPGYETTPNICQCGCIGCRSSCSAHIGPEELAVMSRPTASEIAEDPCPATSEED